MIEKSFELTVRVPATTANCGAGFDCFGIALTYYNMFTFSLSKNPGLCVSVSGEGANLFAANRSNLAIDSMLKVFDKCKIPAPLGVSLTMNNNIPLSRGLGSSSSAVVAGVIAGNFFAKTNLNMQELLAICTEIEGHPDNVAPALLGGITLSYTCEQIVQSKNIPYRKPFKLVAVVPELRLETKKAREVLPKNVPLGDAIFNLSRAALFVHSISEGLLEDLQQALEDRLHQPYRQKLIPHALDVFTVAKRCGAYGSAISGSGSTLIAFAPVDNDNHTLGAAMQKVFTQNGIAAKYHIFDIDNRGAQITSQ